MDFKTKDIIFVLVLGVMIATLGFCSSSQQSSPPEPQQPDQLIVHVAGCVHNPGVFQLPPGSRILDAVNIAGGETGDADLHLLNLAEHVTDGQKITVPSQVQVQPGEDGAPNDSGLVNINTADQSSLETLPGIGPARAQQIIQHRETHGYFNSTQDILNVNMIGPSIFESIKDLITT